MTAVTPDGRSAATDPRTAHPSDAERDVPARFHWWATGANLWIVAGLFLDGWYHIHHPENESFFTPWHGILYSGVGVAVAVILDQMLRGRRRGLRWRAAVPTGYGLSVLGGAVVAVGGLTDMVWHEELGIEVGVEALLSPPHLLLAVAGTLVFAGPLRAARRMLPGREGHAAGRLWPAIISVGFVLALLGFFTQYAAPVRQVYPTVDAPVTTGGTDLLHAAGVTGYLLHAALLAGAVLLLGLRWRLPLGAVTAVVLIPSALVATQEATFHLLPGVALAAALADVVVSRRPPARGDVVGTRIVAAVVPAFVTAGIMATFALRGELAWSAPLVTGTIALTAATGTFMGILMHPPREDPEHPPEERP
jgi:hypothetical protein